MALPANPPKPRRTVVGMKAVVGRRSLLLVDSKQAKRASVRFERLFNDVIHLKVGELPSKSCLVVLSAMTFDVLGCEQQLLSYLESLSTLNTWGERQYATWEAAGEVHRRVPSDFTLLAARDLDLSKVDWLETIAEVELVLARCYTFERPIPIGSRVRAVLNDGIAFFEHRLPRPLVAHLTGIIHWTALPSRVWERQFAVAPAHTDPEESDELQVAQVSEAMTECLYEGRAPLTGSWFAKNLHELCDGLTGIGVKRSDRKVRHELSVRLHERAQELPQVGPVEAVLLGWVLDLVTFGSARKADPVVKTLSNYLKAAIMPLHAALASRGRHPLSLTTNEWDAVFRELLDGNVNSLLRPALSSFQRYMVRAHDAEPIPWLFRSPSEVAAPRANVLWPQEFEALPAAVSHLLQDGRALLQTQVWIALLKSTSMRFGELVRLELRSVKRDEDGVLWIGLAAGRGQPGLKSDAARRVMKICDPAALAVIGPWFDRRKKEACSSDELLFADPQRPTKVYCLGRCYGALSKAMKQVTGDAEISPHVTRHTFASMRVPTLLVEAMTTFSEIRPLDELRVQMGHADLRTTIGTYSHLYEDALRDCVDLLVQRRPIRTQDAAEWTGQSAATLRQRDRDRPEWTAWGELCAHARTPSRPARRQEPLSVAIAESKPLTLNCIRAIAADWSQGFELNRIELRSGHGSNVVSAVVRELEHACAQVRIARHARKPVLGGWIEWFNDEANLSRLDEPRWVEAMKCLDKAAITHPNVVQEWLHACAGHGIDAQHKAFKDVLWFLKDAGFSSEDFVIRADRETKTKEVLRAFRDVFLAGAQTEATKPRRGKPEAYVHVLTKPTAPGAPAASATCDMKALRAALMLAAVYHRLSRR